jgi:hypothetical protein
MRRLLLALLFLAGGVAAEVRTPLQCVTIAVRRAGGTLRRGR